MPTIFMSSPSEAASSAEVAPRQLAIPISRRERGGLLRPLRQFGEGERHAGIGRLKAFVILSYDRGNVEGGLHIGDGELRGIVRRKRPRGEYQYRK